MEQKNELHIEKLVKQYAVRDKVADIFMPNFSCENHAKAIQGFSDAANNPKGTIIEHPADYELYYLGTFNQRTGETVNEKQYLVTAKDVLRVKINEQKNKNLN